MKISTAHKIYNFREVVATGVFMILVLGAIILQVNKQRGYLLPWIHWCFHSLLLDRSLSLNPRLKDLSPMCVVAMEDLQDQYDSQAQSIEVFFSLVFELLGVGGRRLFTRWTKWPVHLKMYSGRWRLYKWQDNSSLFMFIKVLVFNRGGKIRQFFLNLIGQGGGRL